MSFFKSQTNLTPLQKICLSGLFIALVAVLQKVLAINYIPGLPFVRLSFGGPALIIYSSILLGPWCGMLIGAASDVLGYFIFDMSGSAWFPQITAIYLLLGFSGYFIFKLVKLVKNEKLIFAIEMIVFTLIYAGIAVFLLTNNEIELWIKIVIPSALLILFAGLIIFIIFFKKKHDEIIGYNVYQISFCSFILEVVVMLAFGTLMKGWAFGFDIYLLILICQSIVLFFNVAINTVVIQLLIRFTKKYFIN